MYAPQCRGKRVHRFLVSKVVKPPSERYSWPFSAVKCFCRVGRVRATAVRATYSDIDVTIVGVFSF